MTSRGLSDQEKRIIDEKKRKALECRLRSIKQDTILPNTKAKIQYEPTGPSKSQIPSYKHQPSNTSLKQQTSVKQYGSTVTKEFGTTATCALVSPSRFEVNGRYHAGLIALFKTIPSRNYDREKFLNLISASFPILPKIRNPDNGHSLFQITTTCTFKLKAASKAPVQSDKILTDFISKDLVSDLLPFQREGVSLALARSGRVLLADDMGLGKTIQALAIAAAYRSNWPLLVVAPSSMRFNWREQCLRWLAKPLVLSSSDIRVVSSSRDLAETGLADRLITVISYDLLSRNIIQVERIRSGVVILDESHFLKNIKAARTKAAINIVKSAKRVILLSGTPALSRPSELYPQICAVAPTLFRGGFHEFGLRYCAAKECPWGWDYTGCSNMAELQLILEHSIMIRRIKTEVLSQLPAKRRELIYLDPMAIKTGRLVRCAKAMSSRSGSIVDKRSAMFDFFHQTGTAKIPALEEYILDLVEAGRKFLLFAHHSEVLDALANKLTQKSIQFIRIDGRTNSEQRSVVAKRFQREDVLRVALLSITAAGTGLDLTAANMVVFAELFWNPGMLVQAEDRVYRIGQKDSVVVRYMMAEGTADDYIWPMIERKLQILSQAGLNRETFRCVDTTRLENSNPDQLSILNFLTEELGDQLDSPDQSFESESHSTTSTVDPFDKKLTIDSSPIFEPALQRIPTDTTTAVPDRKRPRLVPLVQQHRMEQDEPLSSGRLLVPDSPDHGSPTDSDQLLLLAQADSCSGQKGAKLPNSVVDNLMDGVDLGEDEDFDQQPVVKPPVTAKSKLAYNEDEDGLLMDAAVAAEVAWLTEGLLKVDDDSFSSP